MFFSDWTQYSWYPGRHLSHPSMGDSSHTRSQCRLCLSSPFLHGFRSRHQETGGDCKVTSLLSAFHLSARTHHHSCLLCSASPPCRVRPDTGPSHIGMVHLHLGYTLVWPLVGLDRCGLPGMRRLQLPLVWR